MYSATAELYDLIHQSFKDYPSEARSLAATIRETNPRARTILDVGCGSGEHARLLHVEHGFEVDGLDLDPVLVGLAQAKLPNGSVFVGDMTGFRLDRTYDVVLCLFSAIGYARTVENVARTIERFAEHLAPGGIVIVEPWFPPGVLEPGRVFVKTAEGPDVTVCRMSLAELDDRISRLRFEYLIGRPGGIEQASEVHELGLFTRDEMLDAFAAAGLEATFDPEGPYGRGLYIAKNRTDA